MEHQKNCGNFRAEIECNIQQGYFHMIQILKSFTLATPPFFKLFCSLSFLLCIPLSTSAQIPAPDLQCIKGDTLFWNPTPVGCGPITGYKVYGSQNLNGTYFLLADIPNAGTTKYYHSGANGNTWYYFVQTKATCANPAAKNSDTLSNIIPVTPEFTSIQVQGSNVLLQWTPPAGNQGNVNYIIHRITPFGTIPIDTIFGALFYVDMTAQPDTIAETYYITAIDLCGNQSLFGKSHQSIHLDLTVIPCAQSLTLNWNPFTAWQGGVSKYIIEVGVNNGVLTPIDSISGNSTNFTLTQLNDKDVYCIRIIAKENGGMNTSISNKVCIDPTLVRGTGDFYIRTITLDATNRPVIEWRWDPTAELNLASCQIATSGGNFISAENIPIAPPLKLSNSITHLSGDGSTGPKTYRIIAKNICDTNTYTLPATTIFCIAGPGLNATNDIAWTPMSVPNAQVEYYRVFRVVQGGTPVFHTQVDKDSLHLLDPYDINDPDQSGLCYLIEGVGTLTTPGGKQELISSRSNVACVARKPIIWVPNALVPGGKNKEFKPLLVYAFNSAYLMQIFNRWGDLIFESKDPDTGWDGSIKGNLAQPGVYVYQIAVTLPNGQHNEVKGTVTLVR